MAMRLLYSTIIKISFPCTCPIALESKTKDEPRKNQGTTKELRTTIKCFLLRLPSLLHLLYLAWFYRENSERRPTEQRLNSLPAKSFFLKIGFLKKLTPFLKMLTHFLKLLTYLFFNKKRPKMRFLFAYLEKKVYLCAQID